MRTLVLNRFDGGMVNDPRDPRENVCRICQHFDIFTDSHRLIPQFTQESGDVDAATNKIHSFTYSGAAVFGLGQVSGGNQTIYTRSTFDGNVWTNITTNFGSGGTDAQLSAAAQTFIYYKSTNKLYWARSGRYLASVDTDGTNSALTEGDLTSFTTTSNMVVHPKTDRLYVGYDNKIASKNGSNAWAVTSLTLPTNMIITSICAYGDFLAIGCRPSAATIATTTGGAGSSFVYLWDMDETTIDVSQAIDWGQGNLVLLEELEGYLVGVSFEGTTGSFTFGQSRVIFKYYAGASGAITFEEFTGFSQTPAIQSTLFKWKARGRVLFPAIIPITGRPGAQSTGRAGVWSISRKNGQFVIAQEISYLNTVSPGTLYGIIQLGDIRFTSYLDNSTEYMDKTDETVTYTQTSTYETTINPKMPEVERVQKKQLKSVGATYEALPTDGDVTVYYKVDGGSWVRVFNETTNSATATEPYAKANTAADTYEEFTAGKDYEFKIESEGGAIITSLHYKYDVLQSNV